MSKNIKIWLFFNFRKNQLEIVNLLINLGANLNQSGWIKFQDVWLFGTPYELAFHFQRESKKEIFSKMLEIFSNAQQISWNNMDENSKYRNHIFENLFKNSQYQDGLKGITFWSQDFNN